MALQQLLNSGRSANSVTWNQCFSLLAASMEFSDFITSGNRFFSRYAVASFSELFSITATSSASSSVKEDGCFKSSDLDRLKYFLRYSLNFRCSALRTFSKAHIACLTTWYRSITIVASGKQVRATSKNARLMSITTYWTLLRVLKPWKYFIRL